MFRPTQILILFIIFAASVPAPANSYTVNSETDRPPKVLRWAKREITIAVSASLFSNNANIKYGSDVAGAIERGLDAWSQAAAVDFRLIRSDTFRASPAGFMGDGISLITIAPAAENILMLGQDPDAAAATRIFYNRRGMISEADIVLNPTQQFSTDGTFGTFDLESALTHEIGHLLGLDHSALPSATMFDNYSRNGVLGSSRTTARTLSGDDVAAARALYGTRNTLLCCGNIVGAAANEQGEPAAGILIWAEDSETGRVLAAALADEQGRFKLSGLQDGTLRLFAAAHRQMAGDGIGGVSAGFVGEYAVRKGFETKASIIVRDADGTGRKSIFAGLNGEFSTLAVPVLAGRASTIYLGGPEFGLESYQVGFNSPLINAIPDTLFKIEFALGFTGIGFSVLADTDIPEGDYSVFIERGNGERVYLPGILTVD